MINYYPVLWEIFQYAKKFRTLEPGPAQDDSHSSCQVLWNIQLEGWTWCVFFLHPFIFQGGHSLPKTNSSPLKPNPTSQNDVVGGGFSTSPWKSERMLLNTLAMLSPPRFGMVKKTATLGMKRSRLIQPPGPEIRRDFQTIWRNNPIFNLTNVFQMGWFNHQLVQGSFPFKTHRFSRTC